MIDMRSSGMLRQCCDWELRKAGRKEQPDTQGSDGPADCLGWLSLSSNKLTTYLLGVQEAATREGEMTSHT